MDWWWKIKKNAIFSLEFPHSFPMFLWFCHDFPMIFLCISHVKAPRRRGVSKGLLGGFPLGQLWQALLTRPHRGVNDLQEQLSYGTRGYPRTWKTCRKTYSTYREGGRPTGWLDVGSVELGEAKVYLVYSSVFISRRCTEYLGMR